MFGFVASTKAIAANVLTPTDSVTLVNPSSGTTDNLNFINYTNTNDKDELRLFNASGANTITVQNNVASPPANTIPIILQGGVNKVLSTTIPLVLIRIGTTAWYEITPFNAGITNAANTWTLTNTFTDTNLVIANSGDSTKTAVFSASSISTGTQRTFTFPNASGILACVNVAQTWSAVQTIPTNELFIVDNGDNTKKLAFNASGITTGTTRTLTVPNVSDTIAVLGSTQTFSGALTFSGGITMSASDITLAGNKITTTNYTFKETTLVSYTNTPVFQPTGNNSASHVLVMPTGTSVQATYNINRVSDTTNMEIWRTGSDLQTSNEFATTIFKLGTGSLRPWNIYMSNTKLLSFDTANTITHYVPTIISGASLKPQYTSTGTTGQYAHDYSGGSILTVNNNATATPISTDSIAFLFMIVSTGTGAVAFGQCSVGRNSISLFTGSDSLYSTTSGTSSHVNLYITSSTFTIENKSGSNDSFRIVVMKLQ